MSPFTGDSKIITELLNSKHQIWTSLSGPIESIQILECKATEKGPNNYWRIQIKTKFVETFPACTAIYEVVADWDFMELKGLTVKEIERK